MILPACICCVEAQKNNHPLLAGDIILATSLICMKLCQCKSATGSISLAAAIWGDDTRVVGECFLWLVRSGRGWCCQHWHGHHHCSIPSLCFRHHRYRVTSVVAPACPAGWCLHKGQGQHCSACPTSSLGWTLKVGVGWDPHLFPASERKETLRMAMGLRERWLEHRWLPRDVQLRAAARLKTRGVSQFGKVSKKSWAMVLGRHAALSLEVMSLNEVVLWTNILGLTLKKPHRC